MPFPYIDIHTHNREVPENTITVRNLSPGEDIPVFQGKNFYSMGLHPWKVISEEEDNRQLLMVEDALELDHVIFAGECGLDKRSETVFQEQIRAFRAQAFMAEEYEKPLIIHCVKAWNEMMELHKEIKPAVPWIFHGYNGSIELTRQLSEKNILFSFGHLLFHEKAKAIESLRFLPLEKIFIETDEYDAVSKDVYARAAELKNIPVELLKEAVWKNFNRIENVSFGFRD